MFSVQLCQSKAAYKVLPKRKISLDLDNIRSTENIVLDAGNVLVILIDGIHVVIHSFGELLVRDTLDEEVIKKIGEHVYTYIVGDRKKSSTTPSTHSSES